MMPVEPLRDIMRRTMENLRYVQRNAGPSGPFEVTQLVNSFIGALAHPWEHLKVELDKMPISPAEGWPDIKKECASDPDPSSRGDLIRRLRNAIAHGNFEFISDGRGEIGALRLWNKHQPRGHRTWGAILTVADMDALLNRFVELAEDLYELQINSRSLTA